MDDQRAPRWIAAAGASDESAGWACELRGRALPACAIGPDRRHPVEADACRAPFFCAWPTLAFKRSPSRALSPLSKTSATALLRISEKDLQLKAEKKIAELTPLHPGSLAAVALAANSRCSQNIVSGRSCAPPAAAYVLIALAGHDCYFIQSNNNNEKTGGQHEIPSASRPRRGQAYRSRR
jgi:hypothetical protein